MRSFVMVSLVLGALGCGSGATGAGPDMARAVAGGDMAPLLHGPGGSASFGLDVKPILARNGCLGHHMTAAWDGVNTLASDGDIVAYFTGHKVSECGGAPAFVVAGDPAGSFLYQKISGQFAASCGADTGTQMPFGGAPLSGAEQATIQIWIQQGASAN
jgi:hypothetical protein